MSGTAPLVALHAYRNSAQDDYVQRKIEQMLTVLNESYDLLGRDGFVRVWNVLTVAVPSGPDALPELYWVKLYCGHVVESLGWWPARAISHVAGPLIACNQCELLPTVPVAYLPSTQPGDVCASFADVVIE